ncbi:MAG TPA: glutamate decarboxylase [Candidatus Dormibacteraeota bacterium]
MALHHRAHDDADATVDINPLHARQGEVQAVPKFHLPKGELAPDLAYQIVHDELMLDGNARLNLATFVTTWMEPQAQRLMDESVDKNVIDKDEYPQTAELERRCVHMLAGLWHAPGTHAGVGCSTTGSSEAAMLAGLALKWRWRQRRKAAGLPGDEPNLVMGINVQVCWEKFCRYWDVEPRYAMMEGERRHLTAETAVPLCDENTIGVVAVLGSTQDGSYEPVAAIADALQALQDGGGPDVPLHVDAASGGFIAPFLQPDLCWDFRIERVVSINTSGHKYGLVYPGVGWVVWRDRDALPAELIFEVNYLGGSMPTFALNFSRSGSNVIAQYYQLIRLGFEGYRRVQQSCQDTAMSLSARIAKIGPFRLLTDGSELPVFAFTVDPDAGYSVYDVSDALRKRGWQVPAYTLCANLENISVLRVVVRNGFSRDMSDLLIDDLKREVGILKHHVPAVDHPRRNRFHH